MRHGRVGRISCFAVTCGMILTLLAGNARAADLRRPQLTPLAESTTAAPEVVAGLVFHPVTPCRAYDSPVGAGFIYDMVIRGFCGIPAEAKAVTFTVAAFQPELPGNLLMWQWGQAKPLAVTLNYNPLVVSSTGGIVLLCDPEGPVECEFGEFYLQSTRSIFRYILDVTGYFAAN